MPRGNDPENKQTAAELADDFGTGAGNAEALIIANNEAHSQELVAAGMKKIDEEATAEARENLDSFGDPNGEDAIDVAVRGGDTIVIYEDEDDGRQHKHLVEADEGDKKASRKQKAKANTKAQSSEPAKDED